MKARIAELNDIITPSTIKLKNRATTTPPSVNIDVPTNFLHSTEECPIKNTLLTCGSARNLIGNLSAARAEQIRGGPLGSAPG